MEKLKNYYTILEVSREATEGDIKSSYRRLVKIWHPDRNPSPEAQVKIRLITEAFEILKDPNKRGVYNRLYDEVFKPQVPAQYSEPVYERSFDPTPDQRRDFETLKSWLKQLGKLIDPVIDVAVETAESTREFIGRVIFVIFMILIPVACAAYIYGYFFGEDGGSWIKLILSFLGLITFGYLGIMMAIGWVKDKF